MQKALRILKLCLIVLALASAGCGSGGGGSSNPATTGTGVQEGDKTGETAYPASAVEDIAPGTTEAPGWFKGDLHAHSLYSDGEFNVATVIARAETQGLDFFALTDHNTNAHWSDPGFRSEHMTLLYGVEWTTLAGHGNIFSDQPFNWDALDATILGGDAQAAIEITHSLASGDQAMLFQIDHPTDYTCCPWLVPYEKSKKADCMEVWNSSLYIQGMNRLTTGLVLDQYLQAGTHLSMLGGSDYHRPHDLMPAYDVGVPTTWVYAASQSARDILQGVMHGHAFISHSPDGPKVLLLADLDYAEGQAQDFEIMMGDTLPPEALGTDVYFRVRVRDANHMLDPQDFFTVAVVIKNGHAIAKALNTLNDYNFDFFDAPQRGDYYRVELKQLSISDVILGDYLKLGWIAAITNPIYTE